jgi:hypothetical protein
MGKPTQHDGKAAPDAATATPAVADEDAEAFEDLMADSTKIEDAEFEDVWKSTI